MELAGNELLGELLKAVAKTNEQAKRSVDIQERSRSISAGYRSPDGAVQVTVDRNGALTDLVFGDAARRIPPQHLSRLVMEGIHRAKGQLGARFEQVVRDSGADDATAARLIGNYRTAHPERCAEPNAATRPRDPIAAPPPPVIAVSRPPVPSQPAQPPQPPPQPRARRPQADVDTEPDFSEGMQILQHGYRTKR